MIDFRDMNAVTEIELLSLTEADESQIESQFMGELGESKAEWMPRAGLMLSVSFARRRSFDRARRCLRRADAPRL